MKKYAVFIVIAILFISFTSDLQKKIFRQNGFNIECYVSLKKLNFFENNKTYYWFKSQEIHKSASSSEGLVLHKSYVKFYKSKQLAEKGKFNYGLKNGVWLDWYENGKLKSVSQWKHGHKNGIYKYYDSLGQIVEKGNYKHNNKTGKWINYKSNDTTRYKKGNAVVIDSLKADKKGFVKRLFSKKENKLPSEKESFFKRLFKKKDEPITDDEKVKS